MFVPNLFLKIMLVILTSEYYINHETWAGKRCVVFVKPKLNGGKSHKNSKGCCMQIAHQVPFRSWITLKKLTWRSRVVHYGGHNARNVQQNAPAAWHPGKGRGAAWREWECWKQTSHEWLGFEGTWPHVV